MNGTNLSLPKKIAIFIIALLLMGEISARIARVADLPLYDANSTIGYIPKPNQHGAWLWKYDWAFNDKSMGVARPFSPGIPQSILLIGDSLVMGISNISQENRVGPQLEKATHRTVWPIGAFSWALQNEITYAYMHPEVTRNVSKIIIISNSEDYDHPSEWRSDATNPLKRPMLDLLFMAERKFRFSERPSSPWPVKKVENISEYFSTFVNNSPAPVEVFYYPNRAEMNTASPCGHHPQEIEAVTKGRWYCVASDPSWNKSLYQDGIHYTPEGAAVLARIIANHMEK